MQTITVILSVGIFYIVQGYLYAIYWKRKLSVELLFSKTRVTEGEKVVLEERIENRKWLPLLSVNLKFHISRNFLEVDKVNSQNSDHYNRNDLFSILMYQRLTRRIELECTQRGIYQIEQLSIVTGSLFLSEDFVEEIPCNSRIIVYPCCVEAERFAELFRTIYGNVITKQLVQEDPFMYRGIREYQSYDSMKRISWSATAKTGALKVHVLENTSQREVSVYLNLQKDSMILNEEVLEESIRLAKTFCMQFARKGIRTALYTNGYDGETEELVQITAAPAGRSYLEMVNEGLARIRFLEEKRVTGDKEEAPNDFLRTYGEQILREADSKYIICISNYQRDDFQDMMLQLKKKTNDFLWMIPVSISRDYHPCQEIKKNTRMWRLNWEGARKEKPGSGDRI